MFRLPALCRLCNQYHRGRHAICTACHPFFTPLGPACQHCALPLPAGDCLVCGHCLRQKPWIDAAFAACHFAEPLRTLLHEFKYREGLYLRSFLATLILEALPKSLLQTHCLIPIPLHASRLKQRGFNQAAELAKMLSRACKIPSNVNFCQKIINTPAQASLTAEQRQKNLHDAFLATPLPYPHITLIDDLMTTGSTVNEVARTLKQQGVERVDVWCCARA